MTSQIASENRRRETKVPRQSRGKARVEALLKAAETVFAEKGFEAATMTQIAAEAGASIGSLYQYFPTKDDLASELHGRQLDAFAAMLEELAVTQAGQSVDEMAECLFGRLLTFLEENPAFIVVGNRRTIDPNVKKAARGRLRALIGKLLAGSRPPVPKERRKPLAAVLLHLIRVAMQLREDDDLTIRDSAVAELRVMLRGHLIRQAERKS